MGTVPLTGQVHAYGLAESAAGARLGATADRDRHPTVGTTVSGSILTALVEARGHAADASRALEETLAIVEAKWKPYAYGRNGETIAQSVGALFLEAGRTLATAESCTGGVLGAMIVDVAGSSDYYLGGWIAYTNALKTSALDVEPALLAEHGAVSEAVARAMAEGSRRHAGGDDAVAVTGIAGPGGGTDEKPVGTVYIALARRDADTAVRHFRFSGERADVRDRSALSALQMVRFGLMGIGAEAPLLWEHRAG